MSDQNNSKLTPEQEKVVQKLNELGIRVRADKQKALRDPNFSAILGDHKKKWKIT